MIITDVSKTLLPYFFLKGIGPGTLRAITQVPGFDQCAQDVLVQRVPKLSKALSDPAAWQSALEAADQQQQEAKRLHVQILCEKDPAYPILLKSAKDAPFFLWVRGQMAPNPEQSVAIIGTREPTTHGIEITKRITQHFVEQRWSIVSGLALGCDGVAHQASLDAGGHTVAVMAHGLHTVAPAKHRGLAERILSDGGALVSEFPLGMSAHARMFVQRDRTQAGLAKGVVMIQSDLKGGSLHASRAALKFQRWLAVPYPTDKDLLNKEAKIQANLMISNGDIISKMKLLSCSRQDLQNIRVLRSRADYNLLLDGKAESTSEQLALV